MPNESICTPRSIGSRQGWREVTDVRCPAGSAEIAAGMAEVPAPSLPGRGVWIVPGVCHEGADGVPEVMRGEETVAGGPYLLARARGLIG